MIRLIDKDPIYLELYSALADFIGRQQLVVRAALELGVNPVMLAKGVAGWYDKVPSFGDWGDEWEFAFHGAGCDLRHKLTSEPISWNAPDPQAFSVMPFLHHLEWRLNHEQGLLHLRDYVKNYDLIGVVNLINELIKDGAITTDHRLAGDVPQTRRTAA